MDEYVRYVYVVFLNKLEMQGQFFKKSQEIILRYEKNSNDIFNEKTNKKTNNNITISRQTNLWIAYVQYINKLAYSYSSSDFDDATIIFYMQYTG